MLKSRIELKNHIENEIVKIISDDNIIKSIYTYAKDTYDIPRAMILDYLTMRTSLFEASDFILFCIIDSIEKGTEKKSTNLDKFFTMQEVKTYRNSKYETGKIKFPLRFKMIQVAEDQWIGRIDTSTLMKLRAAQLINYNVNAQRTMQRIVKGEKEIYKIKIDKSTVSALKELFIENVYIPTPFTLNMTQDSENDFYYDEDKCELVIKSLKFFDITDGYHRYITSCSLHDEHEDFNYTMELRVINFSEEKAKQFIYQEDQKTKMKRIDSNALNVNKASNIVTNRLNESPQCNLKGLISRNKGIINFGELSELINYFYFKNINKDKEKLTIISTTKDLIDNFNMITEHNYMYLEEQYSYKQLSAIMFLFDYYKDEKSKMLEVIDEVIKRTEELDNKKFYSRTPKKSIMNEIEAIVKEVE